MALGVDSLIRLQEIQEVHAIMKTKNEFADVIYVDVREEHTEMDAMTEMNEQVSHPWQSLQGTQFDRVRVNKTFHRTFLLSLTHEDARNGKLQEK